MEQTQIQPKPIRSKLIKMDIGDSTEYHRSQRDSVTTTRDQLQIKYPHKKWVISKIDSETFKVTRTV